MPELRTEALVASSALPMLLHSLALASRYASSLSLSLSLSLSFALLFALSFAHYCTAYAHTGSTIDRKECSLAWRSYQRQD